MRQRRHFLKKSTDETTAILYCRVSTDLQPVSMRDQLERLNLECDRRGIANRIVIEDDGKSGKNIAGRAGLTQALELLMSGRANVLMATKLDRLCRSTVDTLQLAELSQKQGWNIVVLDGSVQFDTTTAIGKVQLTMMAAMAQFEREQTRERILTAMAMKRSRGDKGLIPIDLERRIIELYQNGMSMDDVAGELNALGVPTARGGAKWYAATVWRVLERAQAQKAS